MRRCQLHVHQDLSHDDCITIVCPPQAQCGASLVAMNLMKAEPGAYQPKEEEAHLDDDDRALPPHIFGVAAHCFRQCIGITGKPADQATGKQRHTMGCQYT